ncbi:MAG: ATP-binding protein [Bradymonadaceae bacterium]|nr:ATP-binding protein [Lujinxingiaceae bacterium]
METRSVLDDLVHQFSDPLSFLRELVQNSIDAGTGEVEIATRFEPKAGDFGQGTLIIEVDDWGEGMTREIIETKLTRLFSSAKDDDLTKIGRFGIGFVSVFAIAPQLVIVETGRAGESWRVVFLEDRSFELYALDEPVEGTHIRIIKEIGRGEAEALRGRARNVVSYWCKHARIPVIFEGTSVSAPFDIDSLCKLTHEADGTRLVIGFVTDEKGLMGYYNQGLTLKEQDHAPWPYISCKIDSRYLEHTLTRDQILEDKNYHKALKLMDQFATVELPERLVAAIEQAAKDTAHPERHDQLCGLLVNYLGRNEFKRAWRQRALFPKLNNEAVSFADCRAAARKNKLCFASQPGPILDAVASDHLVLRGAAGSGAWRLVRALLEFKYNIHPLEQRFGWFSSDAVNDCDPRLLSELHVLLQQAGLRSGVPRYYDLSGALVPAKFCNHPGLLVGELDAVLNADDLQAPRPNFFNGKAVLLVNTNDKDVRALAAAIDEPEWAAAMLLELILESQNDARHAQFMETVLTYAVGRRAHRLGQS